MAIKCFPIYSETSLLRLPKNENLYVLIERWSLMREVDQGFHCTSIYTNICVGHAFAWTAPVCLSICKVPAPLSQLYKNFDLCGGVMTECLPKGALLTLALPANDKSNLS
jgi:hypothetical protein